MTKGKHDPIVRAEIIAALRGGASTTQVIATFAGRASRAAIYRIAKETAAIRALPAEPPGSEEDFHALAGILAWTEATGPERQYLWNSVHNVAESALAMARADEREGASTADAREALRRVADLAAKMESAIAAVPNLVRTSLLKRLQHDSAWDARHFRRNVAAIIAWVDREADAAGKRGRGTLRKRVFGDAFDYLAGEAWALWKTFRSTDAIDLDAGGPFREFVTRLWHCATGLGADGMPFFEDRIERLRSAEAIRDDARRHKDEARERIRTGLPAQEAEAAADAAHALAARVARGRAPKGVPAKRDNT